MTLAQLLTAEEYNAIILSVQVSLVAVLLMIVPGIAIGWLLARRRFPGRLLVDAIVHLPLVLPPVVVGYLLLVALGRKGLIGRFLHDWFGLELAFTWKAAAIAAAVMSFPLLVRPVRLAMELADVRLEHAARTLGAGRWRTWRTVTLPLAVPGVITGVVLAFARSLGEFGATIMFAGNTPQTRTLPLAVFTHAQTTGGEAPAMRLVIVAALLALSALIVSELCARRIRRTQQP